MPGSIADLYREHCIALNFDPQNNGVKLAFYRMLNVQMIELFQMEPWKFAMHTAQIYARGDYTTGTITLTNGSRVVTGTGVTWTDLSAEEAWIAPGSSPTEDQWVRIGRVGSSTQLLLVDPYTGTTRTDTAYVMRWRFCPLPRDTMSYKGMTARVNQYGPLKFISGAEAEAMYLNLTSTGNPLAFTPANPPVWRRGAGIPDTPAVAPTASATAGAGLTSGVTYSYKYTWLMNGIETGSSATATVTPSGGNLQVTLSGIEQVGALQGRSARIYRADATGIFYKIADVTATPYVDTGVDPDYTLPYYESAMTQYVQFWPRPTTTSFLVDLRYHARPRLLQKDSDYIDAPIDVESCVVYGTTAAIARANNKPAIAAQYQMMRDRQVDVLKRTEIAESPQLMVRDPFGRNRFPGRIPLISPARLV